MERTTTFAAAAVALTVAATSVIAAPSAAAADKLPVAPLRAPLPAQYASSHRSYLRPGCQWNKFGRGLQLCKVYSPAMRKRIPVEILPSINPNNPKVVMALDGYGTRNDHSGFIANGNLQQHLVRRDVTLVAPISGDYAAASYYTDYEAPSGGKNYKWETFLTRELPSYLARNFQVPHRRHSTALVGLSMGSVGIMNLAQRHPQKYSAVNSMSGYYTLSSPVEATAMQAGARAVGMDPETLWGQWPGKKWFAHDPSLNIGSYTMPVRISCGNGTSMNGSEDLSQFEVVAEKASNYQTKKFQRRVQLSPNAHRFTFRIAAKGAHNWAFWSNDLYRKGGLHFLLRSLGLR